MASLSARFSRVASEQRKRCERWVESTVSGAADLPTLRELFSADVVDFSADDRTRRCFPPFVVWIDACCETIRDFDPDSVRVGSAALIEFVGRVADYCVAVGASDFSSPSLPSEKPFSWVLNFANVVGRELRDRGTIDRYRVYSICFVPTVTWVVFQAIDRNGGHFARGLEVIAGELVDVCAPIDSELGEFLERNRDAVVAHETTTTTWTGLVLPVPLSTATTAVGWKELAEAGASLSKCLAALTRGDGMPNAAAVDADGSGSGRTGAECARVKWRDVCGFHLWPFYGAYGDRPVWSAARKKRLIASAFCCFGGTSDAIVEAITLAADDHWCRAVPFLDGVKIFVSSPSSSSGVTFPLPLAVGGVPYDLSGPELSVVPPHGLFADSRAFLTLMCVRRYPSARQWLLNEAFRRPETRSTAVRLHPLLNAQKIRWLEVCPGGGGGSVEEALFRGLATMAADGGKLIDEALRYLTEGAVGGS